MYINVMRDAIFVLAVWYNVVIFVSSTILSLHHFCFFDDILLWQHWDCIHADTLDAHNNGSLKELLASAGVQTES